MEEDTQEQVINNTENTSIHSAWTVAYASATGNLHVREDIPCQDSANYLPISETLGVAVVADGAGSYSNSHIGSEQAVQLAATYFKDLVVNNKWFTADDLPNKDEWKSAATNIFRKTKDDLATLAEKRGISLASLSSTLIVVVHAPDFLLMAHVGDGRAAYSDGNEWRAAMQPYQGSEANETIFLVSEFWEVEEHVDQVIRTHIFKTRIEAFVLMSDGCEKSAFEMNIYDPEKEKYYDPNRPFARFLNPNIKGLRAMRNDGKTQNEINTLWKSFLEKGTQHFRTEVDDKTMVLGVLQNPQDFPTAPIENQPSPEQPEQSSEASTTDTTTE